MGASDYKEKHKATSLADINNFFTSIDDDSQRWNGRILVKIPSMVNEWCSDNGIHYYSADEETQVRLEGAWLKAKNLMTMDDVFEYFKDAGLIWPSIPEQKSIITAAGLWGWIKNKSPDVIGGAVSSIFRKVLTTAGIDAVVDYDGIIHKNEPIQAVFFNTKKAKQVGLIDKARTGNPIRSIDGQIAKDTTVGQMITAIRNNKLSLGEIPVELRTYKICMAAAQQDGYAFHYVPKELPEYNKIVMAAVKQSGQVLKYVPTDLRDEHLCMAAYQQDGYALHYVPPNLQAEIKDALSKPDELSRVKELAERLNK